MQLVSRPGNLALGCSFQAAGIEQKGDDADSERNRRRCEAEIRPDRRDAHQNNAGRCDRPDQKGPPGPYFPFAVGDASTIVRNKRA